MTLVFESVSTLPPLSWCARVSSDGVVTVRVGSGVETNAIGFVEGAWDGEFEAFEFDRAETLAGSGGRSRGSGFVFAAPSHPLERLFVLRRADNVLVSNSLVFLLTAAGDRLDISHPNYFFDLLAHSRRGLTAPVARLRTAQRNEVELYRGCNLEIRSDLSLHLTPKPLSPPPACYANYFRLLIETTKSIAANGAAAERKAAYRLLGVCSRGYDSTAAAALASLAGCREGATFAKSGREVVHPLSATRKELTDDSGEDSLRAIGMSVTKFYRNAYRMLPGHPEAEFYLSPFAGTDTAMRSMEESLRGTLLISGWHGERFWGVGANWVPNSKSSRRNYRALDDTSLSGHTLGEYRLRAGFLHFPLPYVGGLHADAIFRITNSPEMRPWRLGSGFYDRPIARRIAEEAGVPREAFGHRKMGGSNRTGLSPESERDFQDFVKAEVPEGIRRRLNPQPWSKRSRKHLLMKFARRNTSHLALAPTLLDVLRIDCLHALWKSIHLYEFHWGFEKIKDRYLEN